MVWAVARGLEFALLCSLCRFHTNSTWLGSCVSSSPRYTYGQPVQGNAQINVCQQRFYSPRCEQKQKENCKAVTGLVWYIKAFLLHQLYYPTCSIVFGGLIHFLGNTRETIPEACFFSLSHRQRWKTMKVVFTNDLIWRLWVFPQKESVGGREAYETINLWSFLKCWSFVLTKCNQQICTGSLWGHLMLN